MDSKNSCIIIGISGVTCGGKTTLSRKLNELLENSVIVNQDEYFYPDDSPNHVKVLNMDHNNYDILGSLDMKKMYEDIFDLLLKNDTKYLIIEGFTVLNYKPISDLCRLKFQIFLSKEECERRRNQRTYDPPDIPGYFDQCVWPEYCKHTKDLEGDENIEYLDGEGDNLLEIVMRDISSLLGN